MRPFPRLEIRFMDKKASMVDFAALLDGQLKNYRKGFNPGDTSVHDAPDQMLADELRRRGYEVKATKTIIVEL